MKDSRKRSMVKAFSWRVIATVTTMVAVFILTREILLSLGVGIIEATAKMIFYYVHERFWNRVAWGKM